MLNKLPSELIGKLASHLNVRERSSLSRVSRNIHAFFNNSNNSNEFKEFRKLKQLYQSLDGLKVGELMCRAKNDIEIAKMMLNDQKLLNKFNCGKNDYNIRRLAKEHDEIIKIILNSNSILSELKNPKETKKKLEAIGSCK